MAPPARPPEVRSQGDVALHRIFRWIGAHVRGFHGAVGAFLGLGLALVLLAGALFALLAALVVREATYPADEAALRWLDARRSEGLDKVMIEISALGSGTVLIIMVTVASVFLWVSRHRYSAALLWIALLGGFLLNYVLKEVFGRARPELFEWITHAGHLSFPSGHAMNAVVGYGTLAYLVARLERQRRLRRFTWACAALLILLIGLTRPYLGVHYPSDVVAGFMIGFAWAAVCALGIEAVRYFRHREPRVARHERDLEGPALKGERNATPA